MSYINATMGQALFCASLQTGIDASYHTWQAHKHDKHDKQDNKSNAQEIAEGSCFGDAPGVGRRFLTYCYIITDR